MAKEKKEKGKKAPAPVEPPPCVFDEFTSIATEVDSVILLLRSPEDNLVLGALHHLDSFAMKSPDNPRVLFKSGLLDSILPQMQSNSRFVRRFALKLVSQMCTVPEAVHALVKDERIYPAALLNFTEIEDVYLNAFSGIILNTLCINPERLLDISTNETLHQVLFDRVTNTVDLDILHQSLEMLVNITNKPKGLEVMCGNHQMPFAYLLAQTQNKCNQIQISALRFLSNLAQCKSEYYTNVFTDPLYLEMLFEILENLLWNDLHNDTIDLLQQSVRRLPVANRFMESLNRYMTFVATTIHHRLKSMNVLMELSKHATIRDTLHKAGFTGYLVEFLLDGEVDPIVEAIALMTCSKPAAEVFTENQVVQKMFELLASPDLSVAKKRVLVNGLTELFKISQPSSQQAIDCGGLELVSEMLNYLKETEVSRALKEPFVQMLDALSRHRALRTQIMTGAMAKGLYKVFRVSVKNPMFFMEVLRCLTNYITVHELREELLTMDTFKVFIKGIISPCAAVKQCTIDLLVECCNYKELADMLIDKKVFDWLLKMQENPGYAQLVTPGIDAILKQNLAVKFAFLGRLDLSDVTGDVFYATHKIWTYPRILHQIFMSSVCASRRPIVACCFEKSKQPISVSNWSLTSKMTSHVPAGHPEVEPFNHRPGDDKLLQYVDILKESLQIARVPTTLKSSKDLRKCIEVLSELVCLKICSHESRAPENVPSNTSVHSDGTLSSDDSSVIENIHYKNGMSQYVARNYARLRKKNYDCNIFPIGAISTGGFLERAVLFKVLADRVRLPCTLRMVPHTIPMVYNEVALPNFDVMQEECGDMAKQPQKTVEPTHIVDLNRSPGQLYSIGSLRARNYIGQAGSCAMDTNETEDKPPAYNACKKDCMCDAAKTGVACIC